MVPEKVLGLIEADEGDYKSQNKGKSDVQAAERPSREGIFGRRLRRGAVATIRCDGRTTGATRKRPPPQYE